jgi:transposase-like protein
METTRDIIKLRRWCIRKHGERVSVSEICTASQIPRRTFYNWRQRYQEGGLERLLTDKNKIATTIHRTPEEIIAKVSQLRLETGWCPHKIAGYLRNNNTLITT